MGCVCSADESSFTSAFCNMTIRHFGCLKATEQDLEKEAREIKVLVDKILPTIIESLQKVQITPVEATSA